jgi:hypothetical protein
VRIADINYGLLFRSTDSPACVKTILNWCNQIISTKKGAAD